MVPSNNPNFEGHQPRATPRAKQRFFLSLGRCPVNHANANNSTTYDADQSNPLGQFIVIGIITTPSMEFFTPKSKDSRIDMRGQKGIISIIYQY